MQYRSALAHHAQKSVRDVLKQMSETSIRTVDLAKFLPGAKLRVQTIDVRHAFFCSTASRRRRSRRNIRSQKYFDVQAGNLLTKVRACSDDKHVSVVVGNPCFGTQQGWKFGGSPWRRLLYAISKQIRRRKKHGEKWSLILVNESWTTKRCPICRIEGRCDSQSGEFDKNHWDGTNMLNPEGSRSYRTSDGSTKRCTVRGLSCCRQCHTQWSRDFCAAISIGYAFAYALSLGRCERPRYLCSWY